MEQQLLKKSITKNDLVTFVRHPGDLIVGAVDAVFLDSVMLQIYVSLMLKDEGIYWLRGHILSDSDKGKALLANWALAREVPVDMGANMVSGGGGGHAMFSHGGGGGGSAGSPGSYVGGAGGDGVFIASAWGGGGGGNRKP